MSDRVLIQLPRFDAFNESLGSDDRVEAAAVAAPTSESDHRGEMAGGPPASATKQPIQPCNDPAFRAAADQVLISIRTTIDTLEAEHQRRVIENVRALASQLFPILAEQFLADEIAAHLPTIVPRGRADLQISAPPGFAETLRRAVEANAHLAERITVIAVDQFSAAGRCEVTWTDGGLIFDFQRLMENLTARLETTRKQEIETSHEQT